MRLLLVFLAACAGATRDTDTDVTDTADTSDTGDSDDTDTSSAGPVFINELLAGNASTNSWTDPNDGQEKFDDWFELYNNSTSEVDLSGWGATDGLDEGKTPWRFPAGTRIAARGYLLVWASEADAGAPGLHADFKLSKDGETLHLLNADDSPADVVTFGPQTDDVAWARKPDGGSAWAQAEPSPGAANP
jgi:hypothetical protein